MCTMFMTSIYLMWEERVAVIIFLFQQLHVQEEARLFFVQFFPQMWQDDDTLNEMQKFGASMSNGLNSSVNVLQSPRRDTPYAPTGVCSQTSLIMLLCFLACPFHCKMSV